MTNTIRSYIRFVLNFRTIMFFSFFVFSITMFPTDSYSQNTCGCTNPGGLSCTVPSPPCPSATICHNPNTDPQTISINLNALASSGHFETCEWVNDGSGTPPDGQTGADGICDFVVVNRDDAMGHDNDFLGACMVEPPGECEVDGDCDDANQCTIDTCDDDECSFENEQNNTTCDTFDMCTEGTCQDGTCEATLIIPPPSGCPPIMGEPIPTLTEWGLIFLGAFLFMYAIWRIKQQQTV